MKIPFFSTITLFLVVIILQPTICPASSYQEEASKFSHSASAEILAVSLENPAYTGSVIDTVPERRERQHVTGTTVSAESRVYGPRGSEGITEGITYLPLLTDVDYRTTLAKKMPSQPKTKTEKHVNFPVVHIHHKSKEDISIDVGRSSKAVRVKFNADGSFFIDSGLKPKKKKIVKRIKKKPTPAIIHDVSKKEVDLQEFIRGKKYAEMLALLQEQLMTDQQKTTLLFHIVKNSDHASANSFEKHKLLEQLVKSVPRLSDEDTMGWTPLHCAAGHGCEVCTHVLMQAGANPYSRDREGRTPLHAAIGMEKKGVAELLVRYMFYFGAQKIGGMSVLHYALEKGMLDVASQIVSSAKQVQSILSVLKECLPAADEDNYVVVDVIKEYYTQESAVDFKFKEDVVKMLVNLRDNGKKTALHKAAEWLSKQDAHHMCTFLIEQGRADAQARDALKKTYLDYLK